MNWRNATKRRSAPNFGKENFMNTKTIVLALAVSVVLGGCATRGLGGGDYTRSQTRGEQSVRLGVVEAVREVKIDATDTGVGTATGAVLGGIAGSEVGKGRGSVAGAVAGAVVGGIIGQSIEKSNNDRKGVEVTIKLDSGKLIAVTQEADEQFRVGDRVRILSGQGATRVSRL
jgi:outer membrane lipoprotein SlyB